MQNLLYALPLLGVLGLIYVIWKSAWVSKQEEGTDKMKKIAGHIAEGAMAFLKAEYKILSVFVVCVALLLAFTANSETSSPLVGLSFVLGAFCSALAGFIGMRVATKANVRTTNAARTSLGKALEVAFTGGSVMGMGVVGLGVLGLSVLFIAYKNMFTDINQVITVLTG
ncbi:MAG TPA: sodium/proton-translocating pyrophosphatase, partial [Cyclobacteriaceae bacterium]|nr:sodium/proton-translocating pyrophosphatase [Cyclobacteriaceae bacterium]